MPISYNTKHNQVKYFYKCLQYIFNNLFKYCKRIGMVLLIFVYYILYNMIVLSSSFSHLQQKLHNIWETLKLCHPRSITASRTHPPPLKAPLVQELYDLKTI